MGYYEDLEIDVYNLLEEWQTQPGLFMSYAEESAEAQEVVDELKDKIDVKEAQVNLEIRNGTYDLAPSGKITESVVNALIVNDPEVQRLKKEYNTAKKEVTLLKKAEQAFEQRKKALENIVVLTGREQYAEPKDRTENITNTVMQHMDKKLGEKYEKQK